MFDKTTARIKTGLSESLAMPVRQSFIMSVIAVVLAIVALVLVVKR